MDEQLGKLNYEGFCEARGGVGFDGKPLPVWEAMRPELRQGYIAGALKVVEAVKVQKGKKVLSAEC